ncbi:MAG: DcrB-related protein [Planctomycetota bacterium]|nr:DcrB-related protein [Planctomycetota bacterium]
MRTRVSIFLAALALAGCAAELPPEIAKLGYVSSGQKFALDVPQGWSVRETAGPAALIATGPQAATGDRPSVNVTVTPLTDGTTLEEFTQASRTAIDRLPGFKLISEEAAAAGSRRAWTVTFEESSAGRPVREKQLYVVTGGRGYVLTAAATPEDFAAQQANFDVCFRSFRAGW